MRLCPPVEEVLEVERIGHSGEELSRLPLLWVSVDSGGGLLSTPVASSLASYHTWWQRSLHLWPSWTLDHTTLSNFIAILSAELNYSISVFFFIEFVYQDLTSNDSIAWWREFTYKTKTFLKKIPTLTEVDPKVINLVAEAHGLGIMTSILPHDGIEKVLNPMYKSNNAIFQAFESFLIDHPIVMRHRQNQVVIIQTSLTTIDVILNKLTNLT